MELRHIRHFVATAEHGSFTLAAHRLNIAQPALSQSISRLEKELEARLMIRNRAGVRLTPAGEAFLDRAREALATVEDAAAVARQIARGHAGTVRFGFVSTALYQVIPHLLKRLQETAPDLKVQLQELGNTEQMQALRERRIDVAFGHYSGRHERGLTQMILREESIAIAMPARWRKGAALTLEELAGFDLISFGNTLLDAQIDDVMRRRGLALRRVMAVNQALTAMSCVAAECGVAILPGSVSRISFDGVDIVPVEQTEGAELPTLNLSAAWRANARELVNLAVVPILKTLSSLL